MPPVGKKAAKAKRLKFKDLRLEGGRGRRLTRHIDTECKNLYQGAPSPEARPLLSHRVRQPSGHPTRLPRRKLTRGAPGASFGAVRHGTQRTERNRPVAALLRVPYRHRVRPFSRDVESARARRKPTGDPFLAARDRRIHGGRYEERPLRGAPRQVFRSPGVQRFFCTSARVRRRRAFRRMKPSASACR